jgi:catechol 2,3-dioxygenase-like lactoylglutathione lyase family enzyme
VRLQHVSISIPPDGAEEARAFYGDLLGLVERHVLPTLDPTQFIWFRVGGDLELHLMLSEAPPHESAHFCLAVDDGLDELRARIEQAGVVTRTGSELLGRPRFTCRDPFGNRVELAQLKA